MAGGIKAGTATVPALDLFDLADMERGDTPVVDVDEQLEPLVGIGQIDEHAAVRALNATVRETGDEHVLLVCSPDSSHLSPSSPLHLK